MGCPRNPHGANGGAGKMKYIAKGGPPHAYATWCKKVAGTPNADYPEVPKNLRGQVLAQLLQEQGWICAYTMKRVEPDAAHIEHIKPESLCREEQPGSDLDYENLVACYPAEGMARRYRYGAQEKDDWWENNGRGFVSPLHNNCETRFRFDSKGNILWLQNCVAAETTVKVLRLDHPTLNEDRGLVIGEFLFGEDRSSPLSEAQASRAIKTICAKDKR